MHPRQDFVVVDAAYEREAVPFREILLLYLRKHFPDAEMHVPFDGY
jgi:hypothetical protein